MITEVSHDHIPFGGVCHTAARWFELDSGLLTSDAAAPVMRDGHLSIINDFSIPPRIFYVGENSPAAVYFGEDWAKEAEIGGAIGIPDIEAELRLNRAYYDVLKTGQPKAHYIEETLNCLQGPERFRYIRMLTPARLNASTTLVLCSIDLVRASS